MGARVVRKIVDRIEGLKPLHQRFVHEFRLLAGAVIALELAGTIKETISDRNYYIKELNELLNSIKNQSSSPTRWRAGFYYNSAIMRIAACEDKFEKKLYKRKKRPKCLNKVFNEANKLKHQIDGQKQIKSDDVTKAWRALSQLLDRIQESKSYPVP